MMAMQRVTIHFSWPFSADETRGLLAFAFQVSLITYLGCYLLDTIAPGFVSIVFNLNNLLWLTIILGVLTALWPTLTMRSFAPAPLTLKTRGYIVILALVTTAIVWHQTRSVGGMHYVIAPLAGLIVAGVAVLLYFENDEPDRGHPDQQEE